MYSPLELIKKNYDVHKHFQTELNFRDNFRDTILIL